MAGGLKFRVLIEKGLYYPCSENKGADQLRSYCAADLRLCFCVFVFAYAKSWFSHNEAHFGSVNSILTYLYFGLIVMFTYSVLCTDFYTGCH